MKSARIHCDSAEKLAAESGFVEKPPVGIVANECASASYGVISSSIPTTQSEESMKTWTSVSPTYRNQSRRAVERMRSLSAAISGPGSSDSMSWRPPTRRRGSTAIASTMIPMPPSHCVNWRQMPSDRLISSKSVTTDAPVVVNPDMPSKYASSGLESCSPPSKRYGMPANAAASSHTSATTRNPSRMLTRPAAFAVARSSAQPTPLVTTPVTRNGTIVSP